MSKRKKCMRKLKLTVYDDHYNKTYETEYTEVMFDFIPPTLEFDDVDYVLYNVRWVVPDTWEAIYCHHEHELITGKPKMYPEKGWFMRGLKSSEFRMALLPEWMKRGFNLDDCKQQLERDPQ